MFGADVTKSPASSDLTLLLEASDKSDELERVRPGSPGRHRGDRKGEGLKDRAKLAMAIGSAGASSGARDTFMPRVQPSVGGETCFDASARIWEPATRQRVALEGQPRSNGFALGARVWCSRPDKLLW